MMAKNTSGNGPVDMLYCLLLFTSIGASPSGKAHGFGPCIRGFESLRPSQAKSSRPLGLELFACPSETKGK